MSLVAPREGEGRRTEWRSAAKQELHGGRDKIGQRAEAENSFKPRPCSWVPTGNRFSYQATRCAYFRRDANSVSVPCWSGQVIVFPHVARMRHNRRPARSLGDATSEAGPPTAACPPNGGQRRQAAGESEEASPCLRARAARSAGPRGHAETAQRGVSSWRSEIGSPAGPATAPISSGAQVCAGCRFASCTACHVALTKVQTLRFCVRGHVSHRKSNVATLRKSFP